MSPELKAFIDRVVESSIEQALEREIQQHAARDVARFVALASDMSEPGADEDVDDTA